jgi:hypothetical protein
MSAEGHFPGSTTNAHTRGPVLSLVTNWGEVLHQSGKLKLQHDKTINQLFASNETSLLLKLQPPTNSEKCGDFAHGFLRTGEVAANPSSVTPEPAVPASNKDRTVFFSRANTANTFSDIVESFPVFVSVSFGELGKQCRNRVFQKNTLPLSSFSEQVQVFDEFCRRLASGVICGVPYTPAGSFQRMGASTARRCLLCGECCYRMAAQCTKTRFAICKWPKQRHCKQQSILTYMFIISCFADKVFS